MPNDEPAKLTLASSIAARNLGQPKLLDQVRNTFRMLHNSKRTEEAYVGWIRRYLLFAKARNGDWIHPARPSLAHPAPDMDLSGDRLMLSEMVLLYSKDERRR